MPQFVEWREEGLVPYLANNPETLRISRGTLIREMLLRLRLTPTATTGQNVAADVQWGGPWGVIRQLELVVNGSDTILNLTGADLTRLHYAYFGSPADIPDTLGDGATANPPLDVFLIVPFWQPRSAKPMDTVLDARRLASLELRVRWGSFTDVISSATGWTAEPQLHASFLRSSGQIATDVRFSEWRRNAIVADASQTNPQTRIELATGLVYRALYLNLYDTNIAGDSGSPGNLNRIRVKSGPTTFVDLEAEVLRAWYQQRYGLQRDSLPDAYSDGDNDMLGSWFYLDFVTDGRLRESVDTAQYSEFYVEADVTGAANQQLRVIPQALVPPRGR